MKSYPVQPATMVLIGLCVVVALASSLGEQQGVLRSLYIVDPAQDGGLSLEIWRWFTPALIHFSPLHLLFNMMWMWDLGRAIEARKGSVYFGLLVLALGVAANLAQYGITGSYTFGGMSGVVYGLFGYVWIMGRRSPRFGIGMPRQTVMIMLGWWVLCWTGILGPIANWAHAAGLGLGVAWAYVESSRR